MHKLTISPSYIFYFIVINSFIQMNKRLQEIKSQCPSLVQWITTKEEADSKQPSHSSSSSLAASIAKELPHLLQAPNQEKHATIHP